jgi:hypothetical protein
MFKTTLLTLLLISVAIAQPGNTSGDVATGFGNYEDQFRTTQETYFLPRFEHREDVCTAERIKSFNIFNAKMTDQDACGGENQLHCGDSRFPLCDQGESKCVSAIPSGHLEDVNFSLPTDEQYTANQAVWDARLPGADGKVCRPTAIHMPEVPTCERRFTVAQPIPNFLARVPGLWNKCGFGIDPENPNMGFYCVSAKYGFCNGETNQCQGKEWVPPTVDEDGNEVDQPIGQNDAREWNFSEWEKRNPECYIDLHDFNHGSLLLELRMWIAQVEGRENRVGVFKSALQRTINDMRASMTQDRFEYEDESQNTFIQMPTHCPPPPSIPIPPMIVPCLEAAANGSRISQTVARIDGQKADHEWREALKNTNYKMLGEITQCTSGEQFPCDETILAHHPKEEQGSLHCFTENHMTGDMTVSHRCFGGALQKTYFLEYKAFLISIARKWTQLLEEKIWPGMKCFKYGYDVNTQQFDSEGEFFNACQHQVELGDDDSRDDALLCGTSRCCNNYQSFTLQCFDERPDHSKGFWREIVQGGACNEMTDMCSIEDLTINIAFHYNGNIHNEININAENRTVVNLTDQDILSKMQEAATDPSALCLMTQAPEMSCGLHNLGAAGDYSSGEAHYCQVNECCMPHVHNGHTSYQCELADGNRCPADTYFKFNAVEHGECMHENGLNSTDMKQVEILGGDLTDAGANADLKDGAALTDDGTADEAEVIQG